ncbi:hypothetical protein PF005_g29927 [Phytophthora fragariae]|uniref:RxLR effector protein n=1 Tax=Phytophthora fragariae TaxID=53985 RepID=A0A6A3PLG0_9STRA|nr:hypothetical protein PF009_g30431 [Phytophthora fragariae]KAE8965195.1 hypothetical protein PF011_g28389 [Phytophthora fragariae]KAE9063010.1 hypothetical protein PF007_g29706 [Phytophthora fragariae]KAE9064628.1 hypothetical protein PF010_g28532 [Phytophthora fragariae]KAE9069032.1 hypothetical protein PF006_g29668 [Phytophthora fragariae]
MYFTDTHNCPTATRSVNPRSKSTMQHRLGSYEQGSDQALAGDLEEEDSDEDPQDEDRMMNIGMVDDMVTKANAKTITDLLASAKRVEREGGSVKGLMTPDMLKYARNDREFTLFKKMYDGDVSLSTFAKMMKYNPNSNLAHNFDDVYTLYRWYITVRNGPAKHFVA